MGRGVAAYAAAAILATAIFLLVPGLDLWASGLLYRPEDGFFLGRTWPLRALYAAVPLVTDAVIVGGLGLLLCTLYRRGPIWGVDRKVAAFLLLSLAIGPGLLVNAVLKDHWGRARPSQVVEFGGTRAFTPAPLPADQCARNCSFPAGHPAIGFYFVSAALLVPSPRRRRIAVAAAVAAGSVLGIARMAQGGHFLSDVVFSGLLVSGTSVLLHHLIVRRDGLAWLWRLRASRRSVLVMLGIAAAALLSMAAVFAVITQFGLAKGYLVISGVLCLGFGLAAWARREAGPAPRLALYAGRALFVFLAVAASGLAVDLLKLVFGRARPKLLFLDGTYGFFWGAVRPDYWSFPSGHAATAAALATAFTLLWPKGWPLYLPLALVVAASRVIIDAHYLSDVVCGAALGWGFTLAVRIGLARVGLVLAPAPRHSVPDGAASA